MGGFHLVEPVDATLERAASDMVNVQATSPLLEETDIDSEKAHASRTKPGADGRVTILTLEMLRERPRVQNPHDSSRDRR